MNFKRGYKKPEKLVKWGSPKEYQSNGLPRRLGSLKKPKFCRGTKGNHVMILREKHLSSSKQYYWMISECAYCGKKDFTTTNET